MGYMGLPSMCYGPASQKTRRGITPGWGVNRPKGFRKENIFLSMSKFCFIFAAR